MSMSVVGTNSPLSNAQFRRRMTLAGIAVAGGALLLFVGSGWRTQSPNVFSFLQSLGIALILACIAGRTWCSLYISGRKKVTIVRQGPYSIMRHPLYVFSTLGAAGVGALWGSVSAMLATALVTALVLLSVAMKEEEFLRTSFGDAYDDYAREVNRFIPSLAQWRDVNELMIRPELVVRTFVQSSIFLIAVPIVEAVEAAQQNGYLPRLIELF